MFLKCFIDSNLKKISSGRNLACLCLLSVFLVGTATSKSLYAQATDFENAINTEYLQAVTESFSNGHAATNAGSVPYIGQTRVGLVTAGIQLQQGVRTQVEEDLTSTALNIDNITTPTKYLMSGVGYVGINFGNILKPLGLFSVLLGIPPFLALDKFDIILGRSTNSFTFLGTAFGFETSYAGIRYGIYDGLTLPFIGGWKGISLTLGSTNSKIKYDEETLDANTLTHNSTDHTASLSKYELESELKSTVIELNTGFEIIWFNATLGFGTLLNSGETKLRYTRTGGATEADNVDITSTVEPSSSTSYSKIGIEFPIFLFTRFGAEALVVSNAAAAYNMSIRFSL